MGVKTRDSLAIDDLQVGGWYEFLACGRYPYRGVWLGMEGRYGVMDVAPGVLDLYPNGAHIVRDLRWFAGCKITPIPPQLRHTEYEDVVGRRICEAVERGDVEEERERLDAAEPQRDGRGIACWIVAAVMAWIAFFLWFFGR